VWGVKGGMLVQVVVGVEGVVVGITGAIGFISKGIGSR
jgi:hypothetical protein